MKTTSTFTSEHEAELKRIATLNVFASKTTYDTFGDKI